MEHRQAAVAAAAIRWQDERLTVDNDLKEAVGGRTHGWGCRPLTSDSETAAGYGTEAKLSSHYHVWWLRSVQ